MSSKYGLIPIGYCEKDGILWFLQYKSNKLIKMQLNNFEIMDVYIIPQFNVSKLVVYADKIIDCGGKLCILHYGSGYIYEFDIESQTFELILLYENYKYCGGAVIKIGDNILIFPYGENYVLKYNYKTSTTEKDIFSDEQNRYFESNFVNRNNTEVIFADSSNNILYKFSLIDNSIENITIGEDTNRYWGIKAINDYYLLPCINKNKILILNSNFEILKKIDIQCDKYASYIGYAVTDMYLYDKYLYIFPKFSNAVLRINLESYSVELGFDQAILSDNNFSNISCRETFADTIRIENNVYAYLAEKKIWYIFNLKDNRTEVYSNLEIVNERVLNNIRKLYINDVINEDGINNTLDNFLLSIK